MNKPYNGKPYLDYSETQLPFTSAKTNVLDAISTNFFMLDRNYTYDYPSRVKAFIMTSPKQKMNRWFAITQSAAKPFAFTCRDGVTLMTACNVQKGDGSKYKFEAIIREPNLHNPGEYTELSKQHIGIPTTMKDEDVMRLCTLFSYYSPRITQNNNLNTLTGDVKQFMYDINPAIAPVSSYTSVAISKENIIQSITPHSSLVKQPYILDCKGQGYANQLYYAAKPWEAFICLYNTQNPEITIAMCSPTGMMLSAKGQFKLGSSSEHKCYIQDPLWTNYETVAKAHNTTTEKQLTYILAANIYKSIRQTRINVDSCEVSSNQITPLNAVLKFSNELMKLLLTQPNTPHSNPETLESQLIESAQVGHTIPMNQILKIVAPPTTPTIPTPTTSLTTPTTPTIPTIPTPTSTTSTTSTTSLTTPTTSTIPTPTTSLTTPTTPTIPTPTTSLTTPTTSTPSTSTATTSTPQNITTLLASTTHNSTTQDIATLPNNTTQNITTPSTQTTQTSKHQLQNQRETKHTSRSETMEDLTMPTTIGAALLFMLSLIVALFVLYTKNNIQNKRTSNKHTDAMELGTLEEKSPLQTEENTSEPTPPTNTQHTHSTTLLQHGTSPTSTQEVNI